MKLGIGGHVSRARTKVKYVGLRAEEDLGRTMGEGESQGVARQCVGAGLGAGVEV